MWRWVVIVYCLVIAFLAFRACPDIWHYQNPRLQPVDMTSPSALYEVVDSSDATSVYRGSVYRQGVTDESPPLHLREKWHFQTLNVGIHGASKSSPAVDAAGIYVGTDSGYFYALNHNGDLRWQVYLADALKGIHGTAALDQETVYIGAYNGIFYALNKKTGALRWSKKLGDAIGASPVLHNGDLYISVETGHPNGFLAKLKANNGELVWTSRWLGEQSHSSPTLSPENGLVIAGSNRAEIIALNMHDGSEVWSRQLLGEMKSTAPIVGDLAFVTSWGKRLQALRVKDGSLAWSIELKEISQSSPTYLPQQDLIVAGDHSGYLVAAQRLTGAIRWTRQLSGFHKLITSPVYTRSGLWILCAPQTLCALDPSTGQTRSETSLRAPLSSIPTFFDQQIYAALDGMDGGLSAFSGEAR